MESELRFEAEEEFVALKAAITERIKLTDDA
jgi:hypothetical protein